jgi:hypothetical protein
MLRVRESECENVRRFGRGLYGHEAKYVRDHGLTIDLDTPSFAAAAMYG